MTTPALPDGVTSEQFEVSILHEGWHVAAALRLGAQVSRVTWWGTEFGDVTEAEAAAITWAPSLVPGLDLYPSAIDCYVLAGLSEDAREEGLRLARTLVTDPNVRALAYHVADLLRQANGEAIGPFEPNLLAPKPAGYVPRS